MGKETKKRDPMPPPDATPEEIGEFWDTHSITDYWDQTYEVEFQVNIKPKQKPIPAKREVAEEISVEAFGYKHESDIMNDPALLLVIQSIREAFNGNLTHIQLHGYLITLARLSLAKLRVARPRTDGKMT